MDKLCRDWSCVNCGSGWLEEVGTHKEQEGKTKYYCPNCKEWYDFEWRVRETSDPDEVLEPASSYCNYCKQLMPASDMNPQYGNYTHPVCADCIEENKETPKAKYEVRQPIIVKGSGAGIITDREYENDEWTYRVTFSEMDFSWIGENEIIKYAAADIEGQD